MAVYTAALGVESVRFWTANVWVEGSSPAPTLTYSTIVDYLTFATWGMPRSARIIYWFRDCRSGPGIE